MPAKTSFTSKFTPEPYSGCWLWTASLRPDGYGQVRFRGKMEGAHRAAWIVWKSEIPKGKQVLHTCDTPSCVNPDHLFLGNNTDNMRDASKKGRFNQAGENNGASKLSWLDVEAIRSSAGTQREIANKFKISQSAVSFIKLGKRWGMIPEEMK